MGEYLFLTAWHLTGLSFVRKGLFLCRLSADSAFRKKEYNDKGHMLPMVNLYIVSRGAVVLNWTG